MNIELGKYATEVLLSYAGSLVLMAGIVILTVMQARRVARALARAEAEAKLNNG